MVGATRKGFPRGFGIGNGFSVGFAAQSGSASPPSTSYGSIDSLVSIGRGWLGGSAVYNWANVLGGNVSSGTGFSIAGGPGRAWGGSYAAPLAVGLNATKDLGNLGTICHQ